MAVLVRHTVNIDTYNINNGLLYGIEKLVFEATEIPVPAFFMLSGYLFYRTYTPDKTLQKFKSRCVSILIPYFLWNILGYLYNVVLVSIPQISSRINGYVEPLGIKSIILNGIWGYHNDVTWFIRNLIVYIIITPVFYLILKKKYIGIASIILVFILGIVLNYNGVFYYVYYLFGAWIGINYKEIPQYKYSNRLVLGAVIFLVLSIVFATWIGAISRCYTHMLRFIQVIGMWLALDSLACIKRIPWWMQLSFFIYCSHRMILESVEKVILIVLGKNMVGATIDFIIAPFITMGIIILLAYTLKKIPFLWKVLTGNRG